jgi:LysM repeat protein
MRRLVPKFALALVAGPALALWVAAAAAAPSFHEVQPGQRLGSIAKRYKVSLEALCEANGIRKTTRIRPGQRLIVPQPGAPASRSPTSATKPAPSQDSGEAVVHTVHDGQRLGSIARRYKVSVDALCDANGISRSAAIHPGDRLVIPGADGTTRSASAAVVPSRRRTSSWRDYARRPPRRGYLKLLGHHAKWQGQVGDRASAAARRGVSSVLSAPDGQLVPARLVELLVKVSDQFGGRPLHVVSGYRRQSWFKTSRHKTGHAVDFSVLGVPNEAVRDYLRTLPKVGVGYYPNSSFVHLDVRETSTYWIDYAGPGESPKLHVHGARRTSDEADADD